MNTFHDDIIYVIIKNDGPELGLTCRKYYQLLLSLRHYLINTYNHREGNRIKYRKSTIYDIMIAGQCIYISKLDRISNFNIAVICQNTGQYSYTNIRNINCFTVLNMRIRSIISDVEITYVCSGGECEEIIRRELGQWPGVKINNDLENHKTHFNKLLAYISNDKLGDFNIDNF